MTLMADWQWGWLCILQLSHTVFSITLTYCFTLALHIYYAASARGVYAFTLRIPLHLYFSSAPADQKKMQGSKFSKNDVQPVADGVCLSLRQY